MDDSASLPPAFPPWMRKADPILAAEETNGLFQAFRARRRPWRTFLHHVAAMAADLLLVPVIISIPFVIRVSIWASFWAALVFVVLRGLAAARHQGNRLPMYLSEAMGMTPDGLLRPPHPRLLVDLWMAGTTLEELTEALYLELREFQLAEGRLRIRCVAFGLMAIGLFHAATQDRGSAMVAAVALVLGLLLVGRMAEQIHLVNDGSVRAADRVNQTTELCLRDRAPLSPIWRAAHNAGGLLVRSLSQFAILVAAFFGLMLPVGVIALAEFSAPASAATMLAFLVVFGCFAHAVCRLWADARRCWVRERLDSAVRLFACDYHELARRLGNGSA